MFFLGLPLWAGEACYAKGQAVSRQVEKLADGVKVNVAADNPQEVARLQAKSLACAAGCKDCPAHAEGVTRKVENKGVAITFTSSDLSQVAALQTHFAKMAAVSSGKGFFTESDEKGKSCG